MASISWAGKSGNWATGADWIGGVAPGSADDATIGGSGTYTVTVSSSDAAHSLSVDDQGATVTLGGGGTLAIGSFLSVLEGTFGLNTGGVISGGTLSATSGAFQWNGGTVEAVTYEGTLGLSTNGALLTVGTGGLKTVGANGTGSGAINLSGQGSEIDFVGSQLLTTATVDIGAAANGQYYSSVLDAAPGSNNGTLTLTGSTTIDQTNAYADIGGDDIILYDDGGSGSIANNGTINATYFVAGKGGILRINPNDFTNNGRITVGNASTLYLQDTGAFSNTGVITADAGSTLVIGDPVSGPNGTDGTYSNTGTITGTGATVEINDAISGSGSFKVSNSALNLTFNMTTAQLNAFGGQNDTISIAGTINNVGATLSIGTGTSLGALFMEAATIDGGTVNDNGSGWNPMNGAGGGVTFNGVTYDGTMNFLDGAYAGIVVTGSGLVVKGAGGTGNGTINMFDGFDDSITFNYTQTFDNATLNVESADYQDLFQEDVNTKTGVLTLGPQFVLNQTGSVGIFDVAGGTIINQGTINAEAGKTGGGRIGTRMYLGSNSFTNTGKIDVSNGDWVLFVAPTDGSIIGHQTGGSVFTNLVNGVLTGGIYEVDVGSTMDMPFNQPIVADVATIILSGANSLIESDNTNTGKEVTLESSLTTIGSGGALEILGARGYATTNAISNSGTLQLGGGIFSSGTLADAAGSLLTGFGTVASIFADSGAVTASGGSLMFTGNGDTFAGALGGTTIDFAGGTDLLTTGARLTATDVGLTGGATLTLGENLMFAGDLSQGSGTTLALGAYTLNLADTQTALSGAVTGTGLLYFNGGAQSVDGGANLGVSTWTLTNSAATAIDEGLSFAGAFAAQAGATLAIATGDTLAMTGTAGIRSGAAVEGSGTLSLVDGNLNDMAVGGTLTLVDAHLVSQTGAITLGDSLGDAATLSIDSGATYRIVGNVGLARGTSAASTLINDGVFIRASGTGMSSIGVAVTDAGSIDAATGTLDFSQAVGGTGSLRIYAAGTLEADAAVAATLTTLFISPGGTLALGDAAGFAARISKFTAGDTIDLIDTAATKATLKAGDKLQITDGTQTVATLQLAGSYAGDTFNVGSDGHGGSAITVTTADAPMMPNPAQFAQAMASLPRCSGLALGAVTLHADRALMLATPVQQS